MSIEEIERFKPFELPPQVKKLAHAGIFPDDFTADERWTLAENEGERQRLEKERGFVEEERDKLFLRKAIEKGIACARLEELRSKNGRPFHLDRKVGNYKRAKTGDEEAYFCPQCCLLEARGHWIRGAPIEHKTYISASGLAVQTFECVLGSHPVGQISFA